VEEELPLNDGEVVLAPVPQLPQVLVVQGIERVVPTKTHASCSPNRSKMVGARPGVQFLLLLLFKSLLFAQNNGFLYAILAYLYNVL
jgi:hypothetical protein